MASPISVEFDAGAQQLTLKGDISVLARNPVFGAYIRQCGGSISDSGITVPATSDELHKRYQDLGTLAQRLGVALALGAEAGGELRKVQDDERAFADFSREAEAIWRRDFQPASFKAFVEVIGERCTGRSFYRRQLLSAFHLAFAQHACNFSVPGAGKTSIVYAAYAYLNSLSAADAKHVDRLLVVGPLSSFKAWEDEFAEVFERPARVRRIAGFTSSSDKRAYLRGISFADRGTELTLTTYATLASSIADFLRFVSSPSHRTMIVLDEAHNIKRDDGYWADAALQIASYGAARVVLTGTPAPNGYEDLSNLFRFIYPRKNIVGFSAATLKAMSAGLMPGAVERLKSSVRPFYTRIRKADLGLSASQETRLEVRMTDGHASLYYGIERALMPQIKAAAQGGRSSLVRARLMRLRQAVVNPALLLRPLEDEGLFDADASAAFSIAEIGIAEQVRRFSPAVDLQRLRDASALAAQVIGEQRKLVIWSYFIGNLTLLKTALQRTAQYVEIITGATPVAGGGTEDSDAESLSTREAIIDRFHNPNETAILIANPQAVGESISLHKACRTAMYFDRDFNAGKFIQSKDRIHRYSPTPIGPVAYFFLQSSGTIDAVVDQRLIQKEQRLADLIDSEEIPLFSLGDDDSEQNADVRAILEDYERRKAV